MMTEQERVTLYQRVFNALGVPHQLNKAIEELSELSTELSRWLQNDGRTTKDKIAEETADVMIMCEQLSMVFGSEEIRNWKKRKLERLKERMDKEENI